MEITHSGRTFTALGRGLFAPIWPIEEYLVRANHTPAVAARIKRMNPNGKEEGGVVRGVYFSRRMRSEAFFRDGITVRDFIRLYGRKSYRGLRREDFIRFGHKKLIAAQAAMRFA